MQSAAWKARPSGGGGVGQDRAGALDLAAQGLGEFGKRPGGGRGHDRSEMVAEQHLAGEAGIRHRGVVEVVRHRRQEHRAGIRPVARAEADAVDRHDQAMLGVVLGRLQQDAGAAGTGHAGARLLRQGADEARQRPAGPPGAGRGGVAQARARRSGSRSPVTASKPRGQHGGGASSESAGRRQEGGVEVAEPRRRERRRGDVEGARRRAAPAGEEPPGPARTAASAIEPCAAGRADALEVAELAEHRGAQRPRVARCRLDPACPFRASAPSAACSSQSISIVSCLPKACSGPWPGLTIGALKKVAELLLHAAVAALAWRGRARGRSR